jgi:hypothetical protein
MAEIDIREISAAWLRSHIWGVRALLPANWRTVWRVAEGQVCEFTTS